MRNLYTHAIIISMLMLAARGILCRERMNKLNCNRKTIGLFLLGVYMSTTADEKIPE